MTDLQRYRRAVDGDQDASAIGRAETLAPPIAELPVVLSARSSEDGILGRPSRRVVLKAMVASAAAAAAWSVLNVVPSTRRADASFPPYSTSPHLNPYGAGGACGTDTGCIGPTAEYIDSYYCTTCAEYLGNPSANWYAYMLNGFRGTAPVYGYTDYEPNICDGSYDLWNHTGTPCAYCPTSVKYRCHDGYKHFSDGSPNQWVICHSTSYCDGTFIGVTC